MLLFLCILRVLKMKSIRLDNITKLYNGDIIIKNLNLTIPSGKFFALLGPSGCGKTTLLRLIAGFESVNSGRIFLGNEDITHLPIHKRQVNTVFQNYALFPHLNVFDNIAYSQKIKQVPGHIIEHKVHKILKAVHLEAHMYNVVILGREENFHFSWGRRRWIRDSAASPRPERDTYGSGPRNRTHRKHSEKDVACACGV